MGRKIGVRITCPCHHHPLTLQRGDAVYATEGSWYCDKCRQRSPEFVWHCTQCPLKPGYDLCEECVAKAGASAAPSAADRDAANCTAQEPGCAAESTRTIPSDDAVPAVMHEEAATFEPVDGLVEFFMNDAAVRMTSGEVLTAHFCSPTSFWYYGCSTNDHRW